MDSRVQMLAVVAIAMLAGCSTTLSGGPDQTTVTAADVPERASEGYAPGMTAEDIVGPARLAEAHQRALANASYTVVVSRNRWRFDEHREQLRAIATVDPLADRYRIRVEHDWVSASPTVVVLVSSPNGTRRFERHGDAPFQEVPVSGDPIESVGFDPTRAGTIEQMFDSVLVDRIRPRQPDARHYWLSGERVDNLSRLLGPRELFLSADLQAHVEASGLIRSYTWQYSFISGHTTVRVDERMHVFDVGSTQVETTVPDSERAVTMSENSTVEDEWSVAG